MCVFSQPKATPVRAVQIPAPAPSPTPQDPAVRAARRKNRQVAALAQGRQSTILTSGLGLSTPTTSARKAALGA